MRQYIPSKVSKDGKRIFKFSNAAAYTSSIMIYICREIDNERVYNHKYKKCNLQTNAGFPQ